MTRKDYKIIAKVMCDNKPSPTYPETPIDAWTDVMRGLLSALSQDNPRFDRSKFIDAANGK
jgi:hypothetical protein